MFKRQSFSKTAAAFMLMNKWKWQGWFMVVSPRIFGFELALIKTKHEENQ